MPDPLVKTIKYVPYVDPLILDLDGDGLEITALNGADSVKFDTNGDDLKTSTAWAGADDGFVVLDRNGNGSIDAGAEMFGDETVLANGQKAANGFAALSVLDSNHDGTFSAADTQFGAVRIWRDLNQDGISQADELKTLTDSGVASINLASTASTVKYPDAQLVRDGSYTRTDGSTGQAGSFLLGQNNFFTEYDPIEVSAEAALLPDLQGSGQVRDLREAATLSAELVELLHAAENASTRAGFKDAVAELMLAWGNDSPYQSAARQALDNGYGLILSEPQDAQETGWMDMAIKASEADRDAYRATLSSADLTKFDAMRERMVGDLERLSAYEAFTGYTFLSWAKVEHDDFIPPNVSNSVGRPVEVWIPLSQLIAEQRVAVPANEAGYIRVTIPTPTAGEPHIATLWSRLVDDATDNLMPTLRLSRYLDMVDLSIGESGVTFDFGRLNAALLTVQATDSYEGASLFLDLRRTVGMQLDGMCWDSTSRLRSLALQAEQDANIRAAFADQGTTFVSVSQSDGTNATDIYVANLSGSTFSAGAGDDLVLGSDGVDSSRGGLGNDTLIGANGNDVLFGDDGNDVLSGGDGNDDLSGGLGEDRLNGEAGNDTLTAVGYGDTLDGGDGDDTFNINIESGGTFLGGAGNDTFNAAGQYWIGSNTFEGGTGNDAIPGGHNADTYRFNLGDGQDTITDTKFYTADGVANDRIVFASGISASDVTVLRSGVDMVFKIGTGTDQVTVKGWFANANEQNQIERVEFADGTVWNSTTLTAEALVVTGTAGNDAMAGTVFADTLRGGDGNDTLTAVGYGDALDGGDGDDTFNVNIESGGTFLGGAGNDTFNAAAQYWIGSNTFEGGTGNDTMTGGHNADTYRFNLGDGQDTITDDKFYTADGVANDRIVFGSGIASADIAVSRVGNHLVLRHTNGTDQITVVNWLASTGGQYQIERVEFEDGTVWAASDLTIEALAVNGTAGNDNLVGTVQADILRGKGGNDTLTAVGYGDLLDGGDGDDAFNINIESGGTFLGGAGNDTFNGAAQYWIGSNTFEGGTGNDTMTGGHNADTYRFNLGDGQDIISDDKFYTADGVANDRIAFGSAIAPTDISVHRSGNNLVLRHTNGTDQITVANWFASVGGQYQIERVEFTDGTVWSSAALTTSALVVNGTGGNDFIAGTVFADTLLGMGGTDTVTAVGYGDTLDGGDGDDTLNINIESGGTLLGGAGNDTFNAGGQYWIGSNTFEGGTGNDTMIGGHNADTYRFNLGDGQDTIIDAKWYTADGIANDRIVFGSDIAVSDVTALRSGVDMVFKVGTGADQVTVKNWFASANGQNQVERAEFADGTVWTSATLTANALVVTGTAGNDAITGTVFADTLRGMAGNDALTAVGYGDVLDGGDGNDALNISIESAGTFVGGAGDDTFNAAGQYWIGSNVFEGGSGNDTLTGGHNADTYRFNLGDGQDSITDNKWYTADGVANDQIIFGPDISDDQLWFRRVGDDLEVSVIGTADQVKVASWYANSSYHIEQFKTADGQLLLDAQVNSLVDAMAAFTVPAMGQTTLPTNYQNSLQPVIASSWHPN